MIDIDRTHVVMAWRGTVNGDRMGIEYSEAPEATEAVKRLVETALFVSETAHDDDRRSAIVALTAALAPFTETEEGSDTSGLRLCATPESTPPKGEDHG